MWYIKLGAMYLTALGTWTWNKKRAREFPSKPHGVAPGFTSLEHSSPSRRKTPCVAAQREAELMAKAL